MRKEIRKEKEDTIPRTAEFYCYGVLNNFLGAALSHFTFKNKSDPFYR